MWAVRCGDLVRLPNVHVHSSRIEFNHVSQKVGVDNGLRRGARLECGYENIHCTGETKDLKYIKLIRKIVQHGIVRTTSMRVTSVCFL